MLLWYTLFLPPQVALNAGGNLIYGYRFAIIAGLPFALKNLSEERRTFNLADLFVVMSGVSLMLSIWANNGPLVSIIKGGPVAIDLAGTYIIARASVKTPTEMKRVLYRIAPIFIVTGLVVATESLSHQLLIKPIADAIFGSRAVLGTSLDSYAPRYGLTRGLGPFSHQILAGLALSLALPLYWGFGKSKGAGSTRAMGLAAGILAIFSVSSTAFVSLAIGSGLIAYDALARRVSAVRWDVFLTAAAISATIIQLGYNGGLLKFGIRFALSGGSAWFRYAEWQYGLISVYRNPIFGIGFGEYERPAWMITPSIDSFWLFLAVNHGLICSFSNFLLLFIATAYVSIASKQGSIADRILMRSVAFAMANLIIAGFFTSYFGGFQNWLPLLAGAAVSLGESKPAAHV